MEKRFRAAILSAVVLHVALLGIGESWIGSVVQRVPMPGAVANGTEIEVSLLEELRPSIPRPQQALPADRLSHSIPARSAGLARLSATSSRTDSPEPAPHTEHEPAVAEIPLHSALTELAAEAGTEQPPRGVSDTARDVPRQKIDLGLNGSVLHSAVLEASRRPAPRRAVVIQDVWSERAIRTAVERLPPHEGSALLTIEWDAKGRLQSLVASAQSRQNQWQTLADALYSKLLMRPNRSVQARGLRLVYLIRSDIVKPSNQRSMLPESKHLSAETLTDDLLEPINTLNIGVKADTRSPSGRVIAITLASSQVL